MFLVVVGKETKIVKKLHTKFNKTKICYTLATG